MIKTPICNLLQIEHPVALGGMGSGTSPELVSAVSNAGGLGALGCHGSTPEQIVARTGSIRQQTNKPFGLNFLLFHTSDASFAAGLELRPPVMQFAWAKPEQDLRSYFDRSHNVGALVTYMAGTVPEAKLAAEAGADIIIAQGTEGGGHVGWMASMPLLPMVVDAVAPIPVLAAGGYADGRGLVAALALGADGILLGTRFLATVESPLHPNFKQAIVDSDGHDTALSEIPDIASGLVWPGAMIRSRRNRFIERWSGRDWALRRDRVEAASKLAEARRTGNVEEGSLSMGQDAGLIHDIPPAGKIVTRIVKEAEEILTKLPRVVVRN